MDGEGFEPPVDLSISRFTGGRLQPLGQPSKKQKARIPFAEIRAWLVLLACGRLRYIFSLSRIFRTAAFHCSLRFE